MSTASIQGVAIARGTVTLPRRGIWLVIVQLADVLDLVDGAKVQVSFADLTLSGFVVPNHGGTFAGASSYWIAGGMGGWKKTLPPRPYRNDAGVKLSKVVADLATETGETVVAGLTDSILGLGFQRPEQEASATMAFVCQDGWYVAEDGRTHVGKRPATTPLVDPTAILDREPSAAMTLLALDQLAGIVPEATIGGMKVAHVTHSLSGHALRTRIWGTT